MCPHVLGEHHGLCKEHGWTATTIDVLPKFKPTLLTDMTIWDYACHLPPAPRCDLSTAPVQVVHRRILVEAQG